MENRHSRVAAILMSAGSRAAAATADMKPYCRPDEISRVLELAASGWANPFFADRIRDAVERRRTLIGLRLSNDRVLRLYLVRAFGPPGTYVVVWPASDVSSLNDDEAMTAIRRALCDAIKIEEHELTDWLNLRDRGDMVFVAIRATGLSGSLLQHLQHELRNVICLLTLDQDADDSHLRSLGVTIIPSTSDEDERKFSMTYLRNLRVLADRPSR
jgi:hypothetical protein